MVAAAGFTFQACPGTVPPVPPSYEADIVTEVPQRLET